MIKNQMPDRLAREKSPYLLQHAYNLVDWYPWDEEAFRKAKAEDKLSSYLLGIADFCYFKVHAIGIPSNKGIPEIYRELIRQI